MNKFVIITDTAADLPKSYIEDHDIEILSLAYIMDGMTYNWFQPMDEHVFYESMRNGSMPTTSQVNVSDAVMLYEKVLKRSKDILCIAFSSGLSGSYNSMAVAAMQIKEMYPNSNIHVVDSKAASLGEGLMVDCAVKMQKDGKGIEEVIDFLENHLQEFVHVFTVSDLFHLHRGGRVSKATAIVGTLANIKPILHVDKAGHLINIGKCRGRKKSLIELVNYMEQKIGKFATEKQTIFISHGDCKEDAEFVAEEVKKRFGYDSFLIHYVGPTIGAHTGPGVVALFFRGEDR